MKNALRMAAWFSLTAACITASAAEIGFVEEFALSKDRTKALAKLIPGTREYFYYHCLHYQNTQDFDRVEKLLVPWIKRFGYTARVYEIKNRQALLTFDKAPQKSLDYVRGQLKLRFDHQRELLDRKPNLPTKLDPQRIARATLTQRAFQRYKNLQGFEDAALDWLVATNLHSDRRRNLLQRLQRPDHTNLARVVIDDLNSKYSGGFGSFGIHRQMLQAQLEQCLKLKPELLNQTKFVNTYLAKLRPSDDVDWRRDSKEYQAYLDRLWSFVAKLVPAHNSLKAHVLYHRLAHDRSHGIYDKERFLTYIKLPRNVSYANPKYLEQSQNRRYLVNFNADFRSVTLLSRVGNDEPLVREYLHHFFVNENTFEPYTTYLNDLYLKHNFAETKIVNGLGEGQQWYSMLPPDRFQKLQERIDLEFTATNKTHFSTSDAVSLDLHIKNVKKLIVKVFEINAKNYYHDNHREIDTDINLDGLVANDEFTVNYVEPPLRRVKRHFEFPLLKKPGTYIIDFIGNGKSSRALIRKGKLHYLVKTSTAGYVFSVLDEANQPVKDATISLAGREYVQENDGSIVVPFSNRPGRQPIILSSGDFASLAFVNHGAETYSFSAGIYVDREAILKRKKTHVIVRPSLKLGGSPVTLSVLEDVRLVITSTDRDGVTSMKEVKDFKLFEDRDAVYEFQVPPRLSRLQFQLKAKVKNLSQAKTQNVSTVEVFALNQIDANDKVDDLHLALVNGVYIVELLGKTGEIKSGRAVRFSVKHRDFRERVVVSLQSDQAGRIQLGSLDDIQSIQATGPNGVTHSWSMSRDWHSQYQTVSGQAGKPILIPYMGGADPKRDELSLLELRGNTFVSDRFASIAVEDGMLKVTKLPRGDYDLLLKNSGSRIRLRVADGEPRGGYVLGSNRHLEVRDSQPLQIQSVTVAEKTINVQLRHATKFARVHVFATRYLPAYKVHSHLGRVRDAEPYLVGVRKSNSLYVQGRNIGDEYRYIIDRKYARKYPGNLLERPSLLLNPWAIRTTQTGRQQAAGGDAFTSAGDDEEGTMERPNSDDQKAIGASDFHSLDFLSESTVVLLNLKPDGKGSIRINRDELGAHQHIHVVAVDPQSTAYRSVSLPEPDARFLDLRLVNGLDSKRHFTEQKQISVVGKGKAFKLSDITTSKFEVYDNLARVYALYLTLGNDPKLIEFRFLLNWPKLKDAEQRTQYSKYACHELDFFLFKKDPAFFAAVIKPYLKNKKDQRFLDHWLLGDDLTAYLAPWEYATLNVVERILLSQRIQSDRKYTSRHIKDLFALQPHNSDHFSFLYNTALQGSSLDADDVFGFEAKFDMVFGRPELKAEKKSQAGGRGSGRTAGERDRTESNGKPRSPGAPVPSSKAAPRRRANKKSADAKSDSGRNARGKMNAASEKSKDGAGYFDRSKKKRAEMRQFYRKLDKTQEWVENNYYKLPIEQQNAALVTVNAFWNDFANHDVGQPFYSTSLAHASRNLTEMMFALAVLDLPFEPGKHESKFDQRAMTLTLGNSAVVFHKEVKEAKQQQLQTPILVSQNFFRHGDRFRQVGNEKVEKYVRDEFLVHTIYGCQVVVTNPTSTRHKLDVLLQIPLGAVPVMNSHETRSVHIDLQPYHTQTLEYHFYFPRAGKFAHFPVHIAKNEQVINYAKTFTFNVVDELSKIDRESWVYLSQHGSQEDVINFLRNNNLHAIDLGKIAFRMTDKAFFQSVVDLLSSRHAYNRTLWSYAIKHTTINRIRDYLQHHDSFVNRCGLYIDSPLLTIDPVARKRHEHRDYRPLVNARTHQLGKRREIVNNRFNDQYHQLLNVLTYHRALNDEDHMSIVYYMLLQDRIEEATQYFAQVNAQKLNTQIQYDYFAAYLDLYSDEHGLARDLAARYLNHPVDRWRNAFAAVMKQVDEIDGADAQLVDADNRTQTQTSLAATEPGFEFQVESKTVRLDHQNLDYVTINYYLMDIELLFSRNPFVQQYSTQFSYIRPNASEKIQLKGQSSTQTIDLPEQFHSSNVLVEMEGGGKTKSQAYYSNSLVLQLIENYGQLRVTNKKTRKAVAKAYVKIYARMKDGTVRFYKDGYTDLRGRFDYTSLNTNELDFVGQFSILVISEKHGAVVREAKPPKQ